MKKPVVISLNQASEHLAEKFAYASEYFDYDINWLDGKPAKETIQNHFRDGRPIVGLCSAAILIRILAPLLKDKNSEPPVVAFSPTGSAVVPLLGGHHGANDIARKIASYFRIEAAITNTSDTLLNIEFDNPPEGWARAENGDFRHIVSKLAANPHVKISGYAPWLRSGNLIESDDADTEILITEYVQEWDDPRLVYHPKTLAIGIGCERGTSYAEIDNLVRKTLSDNKLSYYSVASHATVDLKENEDGLVQAYGTILRIFTVEELLAQESKLKTPSEIVRNEIGIPSVAEAAALAAAGPDSELIVAKTKSNRATVAIARSPTPIFEERGRGRGLLSVVGLGPGDDGSISPNARWSLEQSSDWVGYSLYLDLVNQRRKAQTRHDFPLGDEEARCRHAIELAKLGKRVALVCSGDAAIYAMAALVYEIIDLEPCRVAVEVHPGISAFQAASARAGAMIGHDFCCISLSDLLTPWEVIEKRLHAAAEGDFVISFYNPRSLKRRDQLERAFAILKNHRPPGTPVVIASNLGRPTEKTKIVNFADFNPDEVDMLTLVMVGSSQSKSFQRGDGKTYAYTPRGYAKKRDLK
jgi:cobalt-precorrin 5A hydrolase / precorrin-3B C17-methyltransferase